MFKSVEKFCKILALEAKGDFSNRVIIGGLGKYLPTIYSELIAESVPQGLIEEVKSFLSNYSDLSVLDREKETKRIIETVRGVTGFQAPIIYNKRVEPVSRPKVDSAIPLSEQKEIPQVHRSVHGLGEDLTRLPGIGISRASEFHQIGIRTIGDLLYYFPRRYDDYSALKPINRIEYGERLTIIATVQSVLSSQLRRHGSSRIEVVVSDGTGFLRLVFFRPTKFVRSFESRFHHGRQIVISGEVEVYLGRKQIKEPNIEDLDQEHLNTNGIIPIYPLTSGLTQKMVRSAAREAIKFYANRIEDFLPIGIKRQIGLVDLSVALHQVHQPQSMDLLSMAQHRLAFDEIFLLQLGVLQQKQNWVSQPAQKYSLSDKTYADIVSTFPFTLTNAQINAITDVRNDLLSGSPMNRLLQGDVGSGKTVIAAVAILAIATNHGQAAIMAPTSILAEQHYRTMRKLLSNESNPILPLDPGEIRLLTGDTSTKERDSIKTGLLNGTVKLLVGTHSLIQDPVQFDNLQLAVIDEQHRFGVEQRSILRKKGHNPHLLVMTATPIPRSLALTLYGDLDLSIMDEMPIGRKKVETHVLSPLERERGYQIIRSHIKNGNQAFIVYPLIESGENDEVKAAVEDHELLQKEVFPDLKVGLLHGRMSPEEKETTMRSFRNRTFEILVSTTVIEVGVDIPNATVMMIEGANRFGLAQLHQLRGRVGRGDEQAICLLIPENENSSENERLAVMTQTNDGFVLAEKDLEQRGPGDFIGYRQSGFADLSMAKITDVRLIEKARKSAEGLFTQDPQLVKPENALLLNKLSSFWYVDSSDIS
jgi:ATP-dependent DNA helicase RecG